MNKYYNNLMHSIAYEVWTVAEKRYSAGHITTNAHTTRPRVHRNEVLLDAADFVASIFDEIIRRVL